MHQTLPRPSFFSIAEGMPLAVVSGRICFLEEDDQAENGKDHLLFEDQRYALVEGPTLRELDEVYGQEFAEVIDNYKTQYLRQEVDREIETIQAMESQIAQDRVLDFLINKLIPKLAHLSDRVWEPPSKDAEELDPLEARTAPTQELPRIGLLELMFASRGLFILDEKVYALVPIDGQRAERCDLILRTQGRGYALSVSCLYLHEVEAIFQRGLQRLLKQQALSEAPQRAHQLQEIRRKSSKIQALLKQIPPKKEGGLLCLYQDPQAGVVQVNGRWYVYLQVPEYVLHDHRIPHAYYRFDATQVGTMLTSSPQNVTFGSAVVMTPYQHPFVWGPSYSPICMGHYNRGKLNGLPLEDAICQYLVDARNNLMKGYHRGNTNTYRQLAAFPQHKISLEEARARNLPITNAF